MTGLIKVRVHTIMAFSLFQQNSKITHLDLAHNKITNHGIRLLSKLLGASSVLTSLNLADNQIHAEVTDRLILQYIYGQCARVVAIWEGRSGQMNP